MNRLLRLGLVAVLALAGCASGTRADGTPDRSLARNLLIGLAVGSAALAVGAAVSGNQIESKLRDDLKAGNLSGRDFADRDAEGLRRNRLARASTFVSGLSLIGVGVVWQMGAADRLRVGPREARPEVKPIFPVPPSGLPSRSSH